MLCKFLALELRNLVMLSLRKVTPVPKKSGSQRLAPAWAHEFGHAIINTIMTEYGEIYNGINFNNYTAEEMDF